MNASSCHRLALAALLFSALSSAHAASFIYEGRLEDLGQPANGRYDLQLSAFGHAAHGATLAQPITFPGVEVREGQFRLDVDLPLVNADQVWLEVAVRSSGEVSFSKIPGREKAIATALIGACWSTLGDSGVNPATNFIGTTDDQPFVVRTRNAQSLRIEPSAILFGGLPITSNTIAGASDNTVSAGVRGATIGGGGVVLLASDPDTGSGGANRVTDHYGTVGGGYSNLAGDAVGTTSDRPFATVGGGRSNSASGSDSTVSGGTGNAASNNNSFVGGGGSNTASGLFSTVSGGEFNTASGSASTVGGGALNCAGGFSSWAGGIRAKVRPATAPSGMSTCNGLTYPGGNGDQGTFVWADSQPANFISTGPNQFLVRAAGGMAINTNTPTAGAALTVNGNVAVAAPGTLSFGTQTRQMLNLWGPNDFGIGVQSARLYFRTNGAGGFSWFSGGVHNDGIDDAGGGTLRMRLSNSGQLQTTTGTLSTLSDARLKDQVNDYIGALDRINALRPVTYHYKDADKAPFQPDGVHMGFIAQEVQQVFPEWVSEGEDGYLMLSMRGFESVAVRAMQELSAENALLRAESVARDLEMASLRARLDALEATRK